MTTTTHHIHPRSRGGEDDDNCVDWCEEFHAEYHKLFEEMLLSEIHEFLDILSHSTYPWDGAEIHYLRHAIMDGELPVRMSWMREPIRKDRRPPQPVEITHSTYSRAFDHMFGDLGFAARHELLKRMSVPGKTWTREKIGRLRERLQRRDFNYMHWIARYSWTRSGVYILRGKVERQLSS